MAMERHGRVLNRVAGDLADQIDHDPELRAEAAAMIVALFFVSPEDEGEIESVSRAVYGTMAKNPSANWKGYTT